MEIATTTFSTYNNFQDDRHSAISRRVFAGICEFGRMGSSFFQSVYTMFEDMFAKRSSPNIFLLCTLQVRTHIFARVKAAIVVDTHPRTKIPDKRRVRKQHRLTL